MSNMSNNLIDGLVDELEPVKTIKPSGGLMIVGGLTLVAMAAVYATLGIRSDLAMGSPDFRFFMRSGILLMLGLATSFAVVNMARPGVGNLSRGWIWALATAALFPISTAASSMFLTPPMEFLKPAEGLKCLAVSIIAATAIGGGLTFWLKQGAPTSPERAGWLVGIASGALGAAAYNIYCPFNDPYYISVWFTLAVVTSAILGRLIVPKLIRW